MPNEWRARSAKLEARHQRAQDACQMLSKLFDAPMLENDEGDQTAAVAFGTASALKGFRKR